MSAFFCCLSRPWRDGCWRPRAHRSPRTRTLRDRAQPGLQDRWPGRGRRSLLRVWRRGLARGRLLRLPRSGLLSTGQERAVEPGRERAGLAGREREALIAERAVERGRAAQLARRTVESSCPGGSKRHALTAGLNLRLQSSFQSDRWASCSSIVAIACSSILRCGGAVARPRSATARALFNSERRAAQPVPRCSGVSVGFVTRSRAASSCCDSTDFDSNPRAMFRRRPLLDQIELRLATVDPVPALRRQRRVLFERELHGWLPHSGTAVRDVQLDRVPRVRDGTRSRREPARPADSRSCRSADRRRGRDSRSGGSRSTA